MNAYHNSSKDDLFPTEKERDFTGVWIPREIYLRKDLSWSEKILLIEIDSFSKKENGCFASNEYFANFLGIRSENISRMISKLKSLGLIEQVKFDGRHRYLKSCPQNFYINIKADLTKTSRQTKQKHQGCIDENVNPLYIRNINTELPIKKTKGASPAARALSLFLLQKIRELLPNFREPNVASWEKEFEKVIVEDNRTEKEIKAVIEWGFSQGKFWPSQFLSPTGVRKFFNRAVVEMKNKKSTSEEKTKRKADAVYLENMFERLTEKQKNGRQIQALSEGILFITGGQSSNNVMIEYTDSRFKENVIEQLDQWGLKKLLHA